MHSVTQGIQIGGYKARLTTIATVVYMYLTV